MLCVDLRGRDREATHQNFLARCNWPPDYSPSYGPFVHQMELLSCSRLLLTLGAVVKIDEVDHGVYAAYFAVDLVKSKPFQ